MRRHLRDVLNDEGLAAELAQRGRETILARHTCGHRADELLSIAGELGAAAAVATATLTPFVPPSQVPGRRRGRAAELAARPRVTPRAPPLLSARQAPCAERPSLAA
jgi:hypothetical protein